MVTVWRASVRKARLAPPAELVLALHLKIAGQLVFATPDGRRTVGGHPYPLPDVALPAPSTRFVLDFGPAGTLYVNDQRRFAWLRLMPLACLPGFLDEQRYGPDPLDPSFTAEVFAARLRSRRGRPIKAALLDQTCVAGLGNIYADKSLHGSGLHPLRRTGSLSGEEMVRLHGAICSVLARAVPVGGAVVKRPRAVSEDRPASLEATPSAATPPAASPGGDRHRRGRTGLLARPRPGRSALPRLRRGRAPDAWGRAPDDRAPVPRRAGDVLLPYLPAGAVNVHFRLKWTGQFWATAFSWPTS